MPELILRFGGNLAALWVASELLDEMTYGDSFWVLALAALVFTIVNWIVKPIVTILSHPADHRHARRSPTSSSTC